MEHNDDLTPTWVLEIKDPEERSKKLHELCVSHYSEIARLEKSCSEMLKQMDEYARKLLAK